MRVCLFHGEESTEPLVNFFGKFENNGLTLANVILTEFGQQIVKHFRTNKILQIELLSTESLLLLVIGHLCHIPSFPPWKTS